MKYPYELFLDVYEFANDCYNVKESRLISLHKSRLAAWRAYGALEKTLVANSGRGPLSARACLVMHGAPDSEGRILGSCYDETPEIIHFTTI